MQGIYQSVAKWGLPVLLVLLLLAGWALNNASKKSKADKALISGLTKNLQTFKNKEGENVTQINNLEVDKKELLKIVDVKDSQLQRLQAVVERTKNVSSALVFDVVTEGKETIAAPTAKTEYVTVQDSIFAVYSGTVETDDFSANISADKDSIKVHGYKVHNSFEVVQTIEKKGLFKRGVSVVQITAKNKASTVTDARSYSQPLPRKTFWTELLAFILGISAAIAIL